VSGPEYQQCYSFGDINERVILASTPITVEAGDKSYESEGQVHLRLLPTPRVVITTVFEGQFPGFGLGFGLDSGRLRFGDRSGFSVEAFATSISYPAASRIKTVWAPSIEPLLASGNAETTMSELVFHLLNFREFIGMRRSGAKEGSTTHAIEHLDLTAGQWQVEVRSRTATRGAIKELREQGGFGLTHIGCVRRQDGLPFTGQEADDLLSALRLFFSFAKGCWCPPLLPVGFDSKGERCWEMWNSSLASWCVPISWCDDHNANQVAELFPGFSELWEVDTWRRALQEAIHWYLSSNDSSRGIDAGIILTQTAIERLSYEYAVVNKKLIEGQGFRDLRASDKFRLLFSSLDIPIALPAATGNMTKLAGQLNWLDAPHALTEVRNSLVHPEHKRKGQFKEAMFEAWNLGLWYFELTVLRLCGFSGIYSNRLSSRCVGQVEAVPWAADREAQRPKEDESGKTGEEPNGREGTA